MPGTMSIVTGMMMGLLAACGAVGPLIPPESVGVNSTIERQKALEAIEEKRRGAAAAAESAESQPDPMLQGQDVNLPPLQPVGTR
jgi:predicted small lipoprotein YifL